MNEFAAGAAYTQGRYVPLAQATVSVLDWAFTRSDSTYDAEGFVTEGPGFNVFVVKDGRVVTPDRGSLGGITRMSVLELCAEAGIPAAIGPVPRALLEDGADEVFTATTAGGVMPISRVGSRILGNDRPGPLSARLRELYWRRHEEGWHRTPVRHETVDA